MSHTKSQRSYCLTLFVFGAFLVLALLLTPGAGAQDIFGRISGTITDASGAVVPNAKVTLIDEATQARRDVPADRNGFYAADDMAVSTYTVVAEKPGFKTTTQKGNVVHAGGRLTVDLKLQIGVVTETVEVTGAAIAVNTTSGEVATTITQDQIENLALNQRHYESLVGLVPGAALAGSGTNPAALTINYNTSVANTNGQRLDGQNWSVDGGFNLDSGSNNSVFNQVGPDFISEVTIQTSNYDAEFGRSASATINVVTKSGGTHYHSNTSRTTSSTPRMPAPSLPPQRRPVTWLFLHSTTTILAGASAARLRSFRKTSCFSLPGRSLRNSAEYIRD